MINVKKVIGNFKEQNYDNERCSEELEKLYKAVKILRNNNCITEKQLNNEIDKYFEILNWIENGCV